MSQEQCRRRGRFITFEGIDGAGKSSHIEATAAFLREQGRRVVSTREPGGTTLGEKLRELLLQQGMHRETEALLMFAARREHLDRVIEPALGRGDWVICDRFSDATYAYQCGGRGLAAAKFAQLEQWVHSHLQPDLTLLFALSTCCEAAHALQTIAATVPPGTIAASGSSGASEFSDGASDMPVISPLAVSPLRVSRRRH